MMQPNLILMETEVVAAQTPFDKELTEILVGFAKGAETNKVIYTWEEKLFNYMNSHATDIDAIRSVFTGALVLALFTGWKAGVAQAESAKLEELLSIPTE